MIGTVAEGMPLAFAAWVFVTGAVIGSFLNVVIARVPRGESIVSPGSRCPKCKSEIRWFDNLPIVSWMLLRAKCRRCGLPISARYPLIEALTGVIALAIVRTYGPTLASLGFVVFAAALIALAWIDLDTWLLPHQITWPLLAVGLASFAWNHDLSLKDSAMGAAAGFLLFAGIALFGEKVLKRETMGWGDVWLLAGIGAWLGLTAILPVVMLSAVQGSVIGLLLIALGRDPAKRDEASPGAVKSGETPVLRDPEIPAEPAAPVLRVEPAPLAEPPNPLLRVDPALPAEPPLDHSASDADNWVPPKHAVPYGPFLALAALEQLLVGAWLLDRYTDFLGRLWS